MILLDAVVLQTLAPRAAPVYREGWARGAAQLVPFGVLDSTRRWCHFLAQILHESGALTLTHENLSYRAERLLVVWPARFRTLEDARRCAGNPEALADRVYGGRDDLGNLQPGDGWRYRGRGLVQLTGRSNYVRIGRHLGLDLATDPELVVHPDHAWPVAGAFWQLAGCNAAAETDDVRLVTRRINGALTGLVDRQRWLQLVRAAYGIQEPWRA